MAGGSVVAGRTADPGGSTTRSAARDSSGCDFSIGMRMESREAPATMASSSVEVSGAPTRRSHVPRGPGICTYASVMSPLNASVRAFARSAPVALNGTLTWPMRLSSTVSPSCVNTATSGMAGAGSSLKMSAACPSIVMLASVQGASPSIVFSSAGSI